MMDELFSPDLETRFEISKQYATSTEPYYKWPEACWGSANGWLMICGPSPGKADNDAEKKIGGTERKKDVQNMFIWPKGRIFEFKSNQRRNPRWNLLLDTIMKSSEFDASNCTTMVNLDSGNYKDQKEIPHDHLSLGCETVFNLMKQSRPRIVIIFGNVTWDFLSAFILKTTTAKQIPLQILTREPIVFRIPGCEFNTLLMKSPEHPSWPKFNNEVARKLRDAVDWFLSIDK